MVASALSFGGAGVFAQTERDINFADAALRNWGTGLMETYDVAIRLGGNGLADCKVKAISIPLPEGDGLKDVSLWMSRSLTLNGKENVPDVASYTVTPAEGVARISLPEPVEIGEGLYVGCSFSVTELNDMTKAPLSVSTSDTSGAFCIHTSRKYSKWDTTGLGLALDMTVTIGGEFHDADVELADCQEGNVIAGQLWTPTIMIRNLGLEPCRALSYRLSVDGGESLEESVVLSEPITSYYGNPIAIALNPVSVAGDGSHEWSVEILTVNSIPNTQHHNSGNGQVHVWPYAPERLPLMEEYTGTWCGWCPRGAVGMAKMQEKYGEKFVGMVYHTDASKDPMVTTTPATEYAGAPWGVLDRTLDADPFYGLTEYCQSFTEGIETAWLMRRDTPTPVEISGTAEWSDEEKNAIRMTAKVTSVRDFKDADLRIGWFVVADGLKGTTAEWLQSNYYSEDERYASGDLSVLYESPRYMAGMEFDHVLLYTPDAYGSAGSLPSSMEMLKEYGSAMEIALADAVNKAGESLVQDKSRLHIVLAVIDASTNSVLNCCNVAITDSGAGIGEVGEETVVAERYYDLLGRPVQPGEAQGTICIRLTEYADGHIESTRIVR
ncbi:MAG: hypothetical protein HDS98_00060 [Bacteroidales bacterium]|nr:hypothetical protein [Bacteroidales bacterium]